MERITKQGRAQDSNREKISVKLLQCLTLMVSGRFSAIERLANFDFKDVDKMKSRYET